MKESRARSNRRPDWRQRLVLSQLVVIALCVSSFLAFVPVKAQREATASNRDIDRDVELGVTRRDLKGPKGSEKGKGKSSKKEDKSKKSKKKGKSKGKKSKGKNAPTFSFSTNSPTLVTPAPSPTGSPPTPPSPPVTISPVLPPNAKSARRPTAAPSLPSKVKSKSRPPSVRIPTSPTSPAESPVIRTPSSPTSQAESPVRTPSNNPTLQPATKTNPTPPTKNSTSKDIKQGSTEAPSSQAFAFSRSIATGPVTIEYGGVLDLEQKQDAIFSAVAKVLTPYLQQNVGTALRNYELTLTYTHGTSPNTYLSNIKVILVLAGNSAQAVQGLTQDQANALLLDFFTGSTLKSLGDSLLAAGVQVTTLGLYQQPSGTTAGTDTTPAAATGTTTNATGSRMGPTGYATIIAGGALVILGSVAIMYGRRKRANEPQFRHFLSKSKDDSTMTSSTEVDDDASSVKRMGIRPAMFASKKDKENPRDMDLSATQQLIDKYRVLAPSVTELTDDFANQSTCESEGRRASHDFSSEGNWSLGYHDAVDPLDHMSVDSTDSMSTTDHHSLEFALALRRAPSAELRMLNGPDLIAATTLPGSAPWTARSYSFSSTSSSTAQRVEQGMTSTRSRRRRWHDESEGEEVNLPDLAPSVKSDAGSVASQN